MGYISLPNNLNNQFQNVNMSNVTQAAQQGQIAPGTSVGGGSSSQGGGNPSTSLYSSGQSPAPQLTSFGKQYLQGMPVQGPSNAKPSGPSGPGPGGINKGNYDPTKLTQDQRQWLWEQNGHKGMAPVGYGGEAPRYDAPGVTSYLPSFTPPPSPTPSATMQPKSTSGATAPLSSTSLGGGVSGQAFPALTQAGQVTKGLQLPGLAQNIISALTSGAGAIGKDVAGAIGTFAPAFQYAGGLGREVAQEASQLPADIYSKSRAALIQASGGKPLWTQSTSQTPLGDITGISRQVQEKARQAEQWAKGKLADINPYVTGRDVLGASTINNQGQITTTPYQNPMASPAQMTGSLVKQAPKVMQSYIQGKTDLNKAAAAIASPEVSAQISKAINQATQKGDMFTVGKLADLYNAVQQNLNFQAQIGQIVTALSAGFGTQNAPGVTETRTPMIQQGIGQALTGMGQSPTAPIGQQPTSEIPYLPTNLQTATPTQQNRPILSPFMQNG